MFQSNSFFGGYSSGILGTSNWLNSILLPDVKFESIVKHNKYYSSQYEEIADKLTPVQALSALSLNRLELERISNKRENELLELGETIIEGESEDILPIIEIAYTSAIDKREMLRQEDKAKRFEGEEQFKANIFPYLYSDKITDSSIYKLYASTEYYYEIAWKLEALENLISNIIGTSDFEYPKTINKEIDKKEYQEKNVGGRPEDQSANQQEIITKVAELSNIKRFQNEDGSSKPTSIRDEIYHNYPEIAGDISPRALFDRVKKALIYLRMQKPLSS